MRRRDRLAAVAILTLAWNAAILAAPARGATGLSAATYLAGSLICHQQPERSFNRDGVQYPVCARCQGLYGGAALGVVAWMIAAGVRGAANGRTARLLQPTLVRTGLLVAAVPTAVSVALAWSGVWDGSNVVRAIFALPLGALIAAVIAAVAAGDMR